MRARLIDTCSGLRRRKRSREIVARVHACRARANPSRLPLLRRPRAESTACRRAEAGPLARLRHGFGQCAMAHIRATRAPTRIEARWCRVVTSRLQRAMRGPALRRSPREDSRAATRSNVFAPTGACPGVDRQLDSPCLRGARQRCSRTPAHQRLPRAAHVLGALASPLAPSASDVRAPNFRPPPPGGSPALLHVAVTAPRTAPWPALAPLPAPTRTLAPLSLGAHAGAPRIDDGSPLAVTSRSHRTMPGCALRNPPSRVPAPARSLRSGACLRRGRAPCLHARRRAPHAGRYRCTLLAPSCVLGQTGPHVPGQLPRSDGRI